MILKDKNNNIVTSYKIGDDGIVYGFIGEPSTGYKTTSLNSESCRSINFNYIDGNCTWRNDSTENHEIFSGIQTLDTFKFTEKDLIDNLVLNLEHIIMINMGEVSDITKLPEYLKKLKIYFSIINKNDYIKNHNFILFDGENLLHELTNGNGVHITNFTSTQQIINNLQMYLGSKINATKINGNWVKDEIKLIDEGENTLGFNVNEDTEILLGFKIINYFGGLHFKIDNINIQNILTTEKINVKQVNKNISYEFEKIIDNKKTWYDNTLERSSTQLIDSFNYTIDDERSVINSKELELALEPNNLIIDEFWKIILDNKNRLVGSTYNGDTTYSFIEKFKEIKLDDINNLEGFKEVLFTVLTNTITSRTKDKYNALKTLKNQIRLMFNEYEKYNYHNSFILTKKFDKLWLDIITEFVPASSIWDSAIKISNNSFNDNSFFYKSNQLLNDTKAVKSIEVDVEYVKTDENILNLEKYVTINMAPITLSYSGIQEFKI